MTNNLLTLPIIDLARLTADSCYSADLSQLIDDLRAESIISPDESINSRDELINALDRDIRDMLHNCNLDMLFPSNDIDALSDFDRDDFDSHDALADRLLDSDDYIPMIADIILNR